MPLFLLKFLPLLLKFKGPAITFIKGNWDKIFVASGILILATMVHFKNNTIEDQAIRIAGFVTELREAVNANITNQFTIDVLEKANIELAESIVVSDKVRATANAAAADRSRRAQIRLDDTRSQLRRLENETPTCAEISRIDIGAACPLSVELLRRAAAGDSDRN